MNGNNNFIKMQIKSIIMINCGGGVNLQDYFTLEEGVIVYVIDSHRPYSAKNIITFSHVCLLLLLLNNIQSINHFIIIV